MGWRDLFSQWNTKTLGGSSKLGVSDYELITDGVHVEVDNLEALEAKNTVGQATNLQSQSGPIPGTGKVVQVETTSSGDQVFFIPEEGECWMITGASTGATVDGTLILELIDATTGIHVELGQETGANTSFSPIGVGTPFIDSQCYLQCHFSGTSSTSQCVAAFIRVR